MKIEINVWNPILKEYKPIAGKVYPQCLTLRNIVVESFKQTGKQRSEVKGWKNLNTINFFVEE